MMSEEKPKAAERPTPRWRITPERLARCTPEALKEAGREIARERREGRPGDGWGKPYKVP